MKIDKSKMQNERASPRPANPQPPEAGASSPPQEQVPPPRHPLLLKLALAAAVAWWGTLITMALSTANPAVMSVPQIEQADVVVTATVPQPRTTAATVERVWKGDLKAGEITIKNLRDLSDLEPGKKYLFPLTRSGQIYRITRLESQNTNAPPIIYPATHEMTDRLQQILKGRE